MVKIYYPPKFRYDAFCDPAGIGSAPRFPHAIHEPSPNRTLPDPSVRPYRAQKKATLLELLFFVIPLGLAQLRDSRTLTMSLLRIEPFPTLLFDPIGHKKSNSFGVAFFVIPLGFEPRTHTLKVYCSTS